MQPNIPPKKKPPTNKEATFDSTVNDIAFSVQFSLPDMKKRLQSLIDELEEEFPRSLSLTYTVAQWALRDLLKGAIVLYLLGLNGSAIVDLYAILEDNARTDISIVPNFTKPQAAAVTTLAERHTLFDFAKFYFALNVWSAEDVSFVKKLTTIRNGVAHRNPAKISRQLLGGKAIDFGEIDQVLSTANLPELIVNSITIIIKSFRTFIRLTDLDTAKNMILSGEG